jgi:hypothetical protein
VKEATEKYGPKPTNKLTNNEGRVILVIDKNEIKSTCTLYPFSKMKDQSNLK